MTITQIVYVSHIPIDVNTIFYLILEVIYYTCSFIMQSHKLWLLFHNVSYFWVSNFCQLYNKLAAQFYKYWVLNFNLTCTIVSIRFIVKKNIVYSIFWFDNDYLSQIYVTFPLICELKNNAYQVIHL